MHWPSGRRQPPPLPVGGPTDGLPELTRQHCIMVTPGHGFVLLLAAGGGPALPGGPFCLDVPHHTRVQTPLLEVHAPRNPGPDISVPADAQRLCENDMVEDEESLGVPSPIENPLSFRGQDFREAATHCTRGRGVPASQMGG